jgi:hypothetical protein
LTDLQGRLGRTSHPWQQRACVKAGDREFGSGRARHCAFKFSPRLLSCVPKTSSVLIARPNRLNVSGDDRAALLFPDLVRLAVQAALRHQLIVLRRRVRGRIQLTNGDRLFLVTLYRWFPSVLRAITIIRPPPVTPMRSDQCAIKTGKDAFAKMCRVAPPKIICRNRLWV